VPLVEQELLTLPEHVVLSVLLRLTDSDYPFGIFKLFFNKTYLILHKIVLDGNEHDRYRKKRYNNKVIFIENKHVNIHVFLP
jgi:hypothetical protein